MIGSMCPRVSQHARKPCYITPSLAPVHNNIPPNMYNMGGGYGKMKKYGTKGRLGKILQQYSLVLTALTTRMNVSAFHHLSRFYLSS
jgi:hypothetical protein